MPAPITPNEEPAAATTRGGLNLVFSTTHPPQKEPAHVSYHDSSARV